MSTKLFNLTIGSYDIATAYPDGAIVHRMPTPSEFRKIVEALGEIGRHYLKTMEEKSDGTSVGLQLTVMEETTDDQG